MAGDHDIPIVARGRIIMSGDYAITFRGRQQMASAAGSDQREFRESV